MYIPRCAAALREVMHRQIRRDFDTLTRGCSSLQAVANLATTYRISDRHVWRVLKRQNREAQAPPEQNALF
jgi:Mor family transcriptional regulator